MPRNQATIYSYDAFKHKQIVAFELRALANRFRQSLGIVYPVGLSKKPKLIDELKAIKFLLQI